MMTYYQSPHDDRSFISWNGSVTFHQGYFDKDGSFIPTDEFTAYGKSDFVVYAETRCTPQEAHDVAEGVFEDILEDEALSDETLSAGAEAYENQNNIFSDDRA